MISWREDYGMFWPDYATNPKCFGALKKHAHDMNYAAKKCKNLNTCIQAGGNIGVWPMALSKIFEMVVTFEPEPSNYLALSENLNYFGYRNVKAYNVALSEEKGTSRISHTTSIGSQRLGESGQVVTTIALDTFTLPSCDAIFLDVEGHELQVLRGAEKTIMKFRPILQLEVNKDMTGINEWLDSHEYKTDRLIGKDCVYLPKEYK